MNPEIILLSGGLDSVVLAYKLKAEGKNLRAIYFDLGGSRTMPELTVAKWVSKELNIPIEIANIGNLNQLYLGYMPLEHLRIDGGDTVDPKPADLMPFASIPTGIPIILSISAFYAHLLSIKKVYTAFIGNQSNYYPKLNEFFQTLSKADKLINQNFEEINFIAPFAATPKSDIIKMGVDLNAPIDITWSCIRQSTIHCGECYACKERKAAFKAAGIKDNTKYAA